MTYGIVARQFMNETLRLFPPVPLNIRRTVRHSLLPTSFSFASSSAHPTSPLTLPLYMPANTSIIVNTVGMQRDPAVWGEDALEFRPSRWQGQGGAEGFAAWNLGPRMVRPVQPQPQTSFHCSFCSQSKSIGTDDKSAWANLSRYPLRILSPSC